MPISQWTSANVVEVVLRGHWTNNQPIVNVMHLVYGTGDAVTTAQDCVDNWQDEIVPWNADNYTFDDARYTDKDTLTGASGVIARNVAKPYVGNAAGANSTPNCSRLVHKNIAGQVGRRAGRMYLPPPAEADVDENGTIAGAHIVALDAALEAFKDGVTDGDQHACVVHKIEATGGASPNSQITTFTTDPMLATQRRRLR